MHLRAGWLMHSGAFFMGMLTGKSSGVRIAGTGSYLPERMVTNQDLESRLDTTDEWIVSHTGIKSRHLAQGNESASSMGAEAARRALENAGIAPQEVGTILVSTCSGDYANMPSTACLVQNAIGAVNAGALDINAACAGFTYGIAAGRALCLTTGRPVLVIATEMISRLVDWQDRATCVLFGDGAGAVVMVPAEENAILDDVMGADGSGWSAIVRDCGTLRPAAENNSVQYMKMNGRQVFPFAVRAMENVILRLLERNSLTIDQVAHIIPHQANLRILDAVARHMNLPLERFAVNIDRVANTSSASVPVLLDEMNRSGKLRPGDLVITVAFGAGLSYGGNLIRWQ